MGQYCFGRWRLSSVVVRNAVGGRPPPGRARVGLVADTVRWASTVTSH